MKYLQFLAMGYEILDEDAAEALRVHFTLHRVYRHVFVICRKRTIDGRNLPQVFITSREPVEKFQLAP